MPNRDRRSHTVLARLGVIGLASLLVTAAQSYGPTKTGDASRPATHHDGGTQPAAGAPLATLALPPVAQPLSPVKPAPSEIGPPRVIEVEPSAQEVEAVAEQEAAKRRIGGLQPDWWLVIFTGILSLGTMGLWLATRKLVTGAEKTAERQLRAYLYIEKTGFSNRPLIGKWTITYVIRNFGSTHAHKVEVDAIASAVDWNSGKPAVPPPIDTFGLGSIGPGGDFSENEAALNGYAYESDLAAGKKAIFLNGQIRYKDVFGRSWRTDFRFLHRWRRWLRRQRIVCRCPGQRCDLNPGSSHYPTGRWEAPAS